MKSIQIALRTAAITLLAASALAQAASVSGTVTDKTTGKPAVGDVVVLVDVQAGMSEAARATTDAKGHYSLNVPGSSPYLIRATHQGATYFIGAPQNGGSGDITVYDVATKVQGVSLEADVLEIEAENGQLRVNERFFVHNSSMPPTTQWSKKSFEVVLPVDATLAESGAQRPGGLPTTIKLDATGTKGHYAFDFPIQPDDGDKATLLQVAYTLPYASGKYTFKSVLTIQADNFAVLMPKSMNLTAGSGVAFKSVQEDPGIQTFLLKNVAAGKPIEFTVGGNGSIPREDQGAQGAQGGQGGGMMGQAAAAGGQPGGGIGAPIADPDPLSKYKWWILGGLALLMAAAAAFLLRAPANAAALAPTAAPLATPSATTAPADKQNVLLNALKDELFSLESAKISGKISESEYAEAKAALEVVIKRALQNS
jgi:hypothetical protein